MINEIPTIEEILKAIKETQPRAKSVWENILRKEDDDGSRD